LLNHRHVGKEKVSTKTMAHPGESRSLRASQNNSAANAPACNPATTSTWKTPVFWKSVASSSIDEAAVA
jgi:hypothetical protein